MTGDDIIIKPTPLSSGRPVESDLAALTGIDQGTVSAKLDAEVRKQTEDRMMNPTAYTLVNDPYDVQRSAAETVKEQLINPQYDIKPDSEMTDEQAQGSDAFSAGEMSDIDDVAQMANSIYPDDADDNAASIINDDFYTGHGKSPDDTAGSVNSNSDMTNTSLDMINSIQPEAQPSVYQSSEDEASDTVLPPEESEQNTSEEGEASVPDTI